MIHTASCRDSDGKTYYDGDLWHVDNCQVNYCDDGRIKSDHVQCSLVVCNWVSPRFLLTPDFCVKSSLTV